MRRRGCPASKWITALVLLLLCSRTLPASGQATQTSVDEVIALKSIRKALDMDIWRGDPCFPSPWLGLRCDNAVARVVLIDLRAKGVKGFIPTTIKDLTALKYLDFSNNNLSGSIPESLGHLRSLETLALDNNDFCGRIPQLLQNRSSFSFSGNPRLCRPGDECDTRGCDTFPDPPAFQPPSKKWAGLNLVVGAIFGGLIVFGILGGIFICFYLRYQRKKASTLLPLNSPVHSTESEAKQFRDKRQHSPPRSYDFWNSAPPPFQQPSEFHANTMLSQAAGYIPRPQIVTATNNFYRKLGEGGYGPVYWGKLANGKEVAVKVNKISSQGTEEFANEVGLLTRIHHRNLVNLLCFCEYGNERFLVYEYQEKGTLSDLLWGTEAENSRLDWKTRLDIALDAAKGLEYLHTGCDPKIIHRDVKSSNILIDEKFVAKVADFGISKATPEGGSTSRAYSTVVRGTPGYLDPEYLLTQRLSAKSDVYSFGVVLMEIIAGCRPQATMPDGSRFNIVDLFTDALSTGDILSVADSSLEERFNPESIWKVADLAYSSVNREGARRPDMTQVVRGITEAIELESYDPAAPPHSRSWSRAITIKLPR